MRYVAIAQSDPAAAPRFLGLGATPEQARTDAAAWLAAARRDATGAERPALDELEAAAAVVPEAELPPPAAAALGGWLATRAELALPPSPPSLAPAGPPSAGRGLRVPPALGVVVALACADLALRWLAWRWWPWAGEGPAESAFAHLPIDIGAVVVWFGSYLGPITPARRRVYAQWQEGGCLRVGVALVLALLLLATGLTLLGAAAGFGAGSPWE